MAFKGPRLQYSLAVVAATAWVLQGYDQALMNSLLTLPSFESTFKAIDTSTPELKRNTPPWKAQPSHSCFFIGEKFGRKRTTLAGACCVLIGVVLQTTAFSLAQLIVARIVTGLGVGSFTATLPTWVGESANSESREWLVMLEGSAAIFVSHTLHPRSLTCITPRYASEIAPLEVRSQVCAMSAAFNWLFNFLIAEVTPHAFASIGWKYFLVFVCTNSLSVVFFYLFAPETRNRTLEDIDAIFLSSRGLFQPVKTARTLRDGIAEEFDLSAKDGNKAMHKEAA